MGDDQPQQAGPSRFPPSSDHLNPSSPPSPIHRPASTESSNPFTRPKYSRIQNTRRSMAAADGNKRKEHEGSPLYQTQHTNYGTNHSPKHYFTPQHYGPAQMLSLSPREFEEQMNERYENLQEMRPYHLIGNSKPLAAWPELRMDDADIARIKNRKLRKFYNRQNELIDRYCEIDELLDSGISVSMLRVYGQDLQRIHEPQDHRHGAPANIDVEGSPLLNQRKQESSNVVMFAIYVNFVVNVVLLAGKMIVAVLTNSLSVIASLVDSILDFLSTVIIWFSTRLVGQSDWRTKHLYPVGRNRLEPIGVLVFSILIIVSFLQIANEAVQKLWKGEGDIVNLGTPSLIIMIMTVVVKVFCWVWCRSINSSAVQALAQDAMTDIVFNTFSILFPLLSYYTKHWWFDPLGALFLSCYIIYSWGQTALEHIDNLTGTAASDEDRQVLLYAAVRFAESVKQITNMNAYHTGDRIMVEVDLVLDGTLSLKDSHDIGEALQYALETLPFVERAFVHLDYRTGNFTGHLAN